MAINTNHFADMLKHIYSTGLFPYTYFSIFQISDRDLLFLLQTSNVYCITVAGAALNSLTYR